MLQNRCFLCFQLINYQAEIHNSHSNSDELTKSTTSTALHIRRQSENYRIQLLGKDLQATQTAQNRGGVFGALPKEKM